MGQLWDIIQAHIDHSPYPPSERQVATKLGVAPNALSNWKHLRRLPQPENLRRIANLTGTPYRVVLNAALHDADYLTEEPTYEPPMTTVTPAPTGTAPELVAPVPPPPGTLAGPALPSGTKPTDFSLPRGSLPKKGQRKKRTGTHARTDTEDRTT